MKAIVFKPSDLPEFIDNYKDAASEELLRAIWRFGNTRFNKGFSAGRKNGWTVDEIIEELKDIDAFDAAKYFFDKFN